MKFRDVAGAVQRLLVLIVLTWSGVYLLLYLYRWEWNRALIAGLFFVSAQLALSVSIVLRRIGELERRIDEGAPVEPRAEPIASRPNPFAWLAPERGTAVFIPVLLGVGVILSALAYVVERVAAFTAPPVRSRRRDDFAPLRPVPATGGAPPRGGPSAPSRLAQRRRGPGIGRTVVVWAAAVLLVVLAVTTIMEATQSRPDPADRPVLTVVLLDVQQKGNRVPVGEAAEALWVACRPRLGAAPHPSLELIEVGDGGRIRLELRPGLGETATRRFTGCLRDATLDLVRADVVDTASFD